MMVWLRAPGEGELAIGLADAVIPAHAQGRLMSLDEAWVATHQACEARMAEAQARAKACLGEAEIAAASLLADAQASYETAALRGAEQGRVDALAQWWEEADAALALRHAAQLASRDEVAAIVVEAVSRIVRVHAPGDLFARAVQTVEGIIGEHAAIVVQVHPEDQAAASEAFAQLAERWRAAGKPMSVTVEADAGLAAGACVCQTEVGTVDASLDVQLRALAAVLQRSLDKQEG
ncbi:Type III secretion cytoplasmic protein (YscL) [plant metagenome]|uniref:Type III secretion cytoplasmic protein (YscL) n=1 Tax=plant metagenome TaxID=1297885 RepID=A0A484P555_9ZZZZ